jgi:hypothetical protein
MTKKKKRIKDVVGNIITLAFILGILLANVAMVWYFFANVLVITPSQATLSATISWHIDMWFSIAILFLIVLDGFIAYSIMPICGDF